MSDQSLEELIKNIRDCAEKSDHDKLSEPLFWKDSLVNQLIAEIGYCVNRHAGSAS